MLPIYTAMNRIRMMRAGNAELKCCSPRQKQIGLGHQLMVVTGSKCVRAIAPIGDRRSMANDLIVVYVLGFCAGPAGAGTTGVFV